MILRSRLHSNRSYSDCNKRLVRNRHAAGHRLYPLRCNSATIISQHFANMPERFLSCVAPGRGTLVFERRTIRPPPVFIGLDDNFESCQRSTASAPVEVTRYRSIQRRPEQSVGCSAQIGRIRRRCAGTASLRSCRFCLIPDARMRSGHVKPSRTQLIERLQLVDKPADHRQPLRPEGRVACVQSERRQQFAVPQACRRRAACRDSVRQNRRAFPDTPHRANSPGNRRTHRHRHKTANG